MLAMTMWLIFRFKLRALSNQAQDKYGHTRKVLLVIASILAVLSLWHHSSIVIFPH